MDSLDALRTSIDALGPLGKTLKPHVVALERDLALRTRQVEALEKVNQITAALAGVDDLRDVDVVLERILEEALSLGGADRGMVVLTDEEEPDGFSIRASHRLGEADDGDLAVSTSLVRQILERGEGIVTTNAQQDDRFDAGASLMALDIRSVMAAPIRLGDRTIGGIYVDTRFTDRTFDEADLRTFAVFADNAAIALNLAKSMRERRQLYLQSVLALANAVEAADAYTAGHSNRVGYYAHGIARELGFDDAGLERIAIAGYLHDVGKIALTKNVTKPGKLTDEEWAQMKLHTVHGERILRDAPALAPILPAVRSHHERWDGRGYPDGLAGDQIDPLARILAVADSFDAMTTDRPYRKAFELAHALGEIESNVDTMYERAAAEAFLAAFERGRLALATTSNDDETLYEAVRDLGS